MTCRVAVDNVEDDAGEEGAEDDLQSDLRREGNESDQQGDGDPDPDLGGGVLEPGEEGVQPQAAVRGAEGQPDRGGGGAENPERDGIAGGSCPGCREEQRQQRDRPELAEGRAPDRTLAGPGT